MSPPTLAPSRPPLQFSSSRIPGDSLKERTAKVVWTIAALLALMGLTSANPLITCVAMLVPPLLFQLLWRTGEPPVLLFATCFQWLQVIAPILSANLEGRTLFDRFLGPELEQAAWLSLAGLLVLAFGMAAATRRLTVTTSQLYQRQSNVLSYRQLYKAYVVCFVLSTLLTFVAARLGSIRQPLLGLASFRWVPVILIAWKATQAQQWPKGFVTIIIFEIGIGFLSFFSSFKYVLMLLLVVNTGASTLRGKISMRTLMPLALLTLLLAVWWQTIKIEYRLFLNQGTKQQAVKVSVMRRLEFLALSATSITSTAMYKGLVSGVERLGYLDYFAYTIRHVPRNVPYQYGDLWGGAIMHVLKPRLLFPNKPAISDSKRTNKFSGQRVAAEEQGTSISIGYMGESYIDFGPIGMFVPIYLLGYFYGYIYRTFSRLPGFEILGLSAAMSLLMFSSLYLGQSNIKIMGGTTVGVLVMALVFRLWKEPIWAWLCEKHLLPSMPKRATVPRYRSNRF